MILKPIEVTPEHPFIIRTSITVFISLNLEHPLSVTLFEYEVSKKVSFYNFAIYPNAISSTALEHPEIYSSSICEFLEIKSYKAVDWRPKQSERSTETRFCKFLKRSAKARFETFYILLKQSSVRFGATKLILLMNESEIQ
jgi:hypothetical protein